MNPNLWWKVKPSMVNMKTEMITDIPEKDMNLKRLVKLNLGGKEKKKADTGGKDPIANIEENEALLETTGTEILMDVIKVGEIETIIAENTEIITAAEEAEIPLETEIIPETEMTLEAPEVETNTEEAMIPEKGMTPEEGLITDTEETVPEEEALLMR